MIAKKTERPVTIWAYLAYGAGDLYGGGTFFLVTTFCMYYLVNVVGLHPFVAGLVPAIGNVWDAISDPLMGYIADNTPQNRFGKRRVWFLISIVPIAVSFILIWFPVSIASERGRFIFYLCAYLFFFTAATVAYIPYAALSAEMTHDFAERNKLNTFRIMFSFISTLTAGLAAQPIIDAYNGSKYGYFVMSIVFALFFALPWITLYLGTWELPAAPQPKQKARSFFLNFLFLFRNKSCRLHIAMYVCSYGALDIFMSLVLFYFVDYLGKSSFFIIAQGSLLITMMLVLPLYNKLATKKGHGAAYLTGLTLFVAGLILMSFHRPDTSNVLLILNVIMMGAGIAGGNLIPHQLLPFISDIDRLITGQNRAGTYSAAMSLTRKLFLGVVIMTVIGSVLSGIGYKNPVPSILTDSQFQEGVTLCTAHGKDAAVLRRFYTQYSDGNWHLRYISQDTDVIIRTIHKKQLKKNANPEYALFFEQHKTFEHIPSAIFEEYILGSLNMKDYQDAERAFFLECVYQKETDEQTGGYTDEQTGGYTDQQTDRYTYQYVKTPASDVVSKDDLYDLKVLLDSITFSYQGLGTVQKPQQKAYTLKGVRLAFIFLPLVMLCLGILFASQFKVTPETHAVIIAEAQRLDDGGSKAAVDPETKRICELLTGLPYEKLRS